MCKLNAPQFTDEDAARKYLEAIRWPHGPVCPHCGTVDKAYATKRPGKYRCASKECRKDFTVKVGTVFESSHIQLHKWLLAAYLLCSSKNLMPSAESTTCRTRSLGGLPLRWVRRRLSPS